MRLVNADHAPLYLDKVACEKIKMMPTINAVPVIRCKECIHREDIEGWGNSGGYCVIHSSACCGYCEDGERKEGAD